MTIGAVFGGAALIVAAYAFHWRARLLGAKALGWPGAPLVLRMALDLAAAVFVLAGLWQSVAGRLPLWLLIAVELALALYAVVFAINLGRQRAPRG
jgi:hypothetical protein